jgi:hypothetical protein
MTPGSTAKDSPATAWTTPPAGSWKLLTKFVARSIAPLYLKPARLWRRRSEDPLEPQRRTLRAWVSLRRRGR